MIKNISVIGAGTMGNGIAHVFAQNGFSVYEDGQRIRHATCEGVDIETDEFRSFSANRIRMVERV